MTKKVYNQPAVVVAQFESTGLMQVSGSAEPATISIQPGSTNKQW